MNKFQAAAFWCVRFRGQVLHDKTLIELSDIHATAERCALQMPNVTTTIMV